MIKRALESTYDRTFGALRNSIVKVGRSYSSSARWVQILYVVAIIAFMAGGVSAFFFPVPNQGYIIYPASGAQTIAETVIDSFVIILGGAGIYVTYLSGRQTTKPRMVNLYLALAILLISLSVIMGIFLSDLKG
jgi:hypothetical protein